MTPAARAATPVWDLPTRLFHWLLVALFGFCWWSARHGHMDWHLQAGLGLVALLVFRLVWGVIGGSTARFAGFVRSPARVLAYLRGRGGDAAGHNPLGGYSVVALLTLTAVQLASGLFAIDEDGNEGPLNHWLSYDTGEAAARLHGLSFYAMLALASLHLAAIGYYWLVKRRNLVTPMLTGRDPQIGGAAGGLRPAGWRRLAVAMTIAGLAGWWIAKGAPV